MHCIILNIISPYNYHLKLRAVILSVRHVLTILSFTLFYHYLLFLLSRVITEKTTPVILMKKDNPLTLGKTTPVALGMTLEAPTFFRPPRATTLYHNYPSKRALDADG